MTPVSSPSPSPRRRRIAPEPSQSLIAMQKRGLELTSPRRDAVPTSQVGLPDSTHTTALPSMQTVTVSPSESHFTKASSIYSTASMESAGSADSADTTISHIIEMYTDLINKISIETVPPNIELVQPKAYRDTVAPLLRRRFSDEHTYCATTTFPMPIAISGDPVKESRSSLSSAHKQVTDFQEFSRQLRDRRAELVSPLSMDSFTHAHQLTLRGTSNLSPTKLQTRPFSFGSDEGISDLSIDDHPAVSPLLISEDDSSSRNPSRPQSVGLELCRNTSNESRPLAVRSQLEETLMYTKPRGPWNEQPSPPPSQVSHRQDLSLQNENSQSYQDRSTRSHSIGHVVAHVGISDTVRAVLRERSERKKEVRESGDIIATATHRYPAMKGDQHGPDLLSTENGRSVLRSGADNVIRRMSITTPAHHDVPVSRPPRRREKPAAIPLTPYQKYGPEIWSPKRKRRREARGRDRPAGQIGEAQPQPRPTSFESYRPRHKRTSSSRSFAAVDPKASLGVKNSFLATLEGVKNSLTHTPAEKRRERLKESIVIVGPSQRPLTKCVFD